MRKDSMPEDIDERTTLRLVVDLQAEPEPVQLQRCDFCQQPAAYLYSVGYEHWQVCYQCRDRYPEDDVWLGQ